MAKCEIEIHSTEKRTKEGRPFRSYFATHLNGGKLGKGVSVEFTKTAGKPRNDHFIATIVDPKLSNFGTDRNGYPRLFISDPYTETPVEPRAESGAKLSDLGNWQEGDALPF